MILYDYSSIASAFLCHRWNVSHLFNCRIVAYQDGAPAGCGAWKQIDETTFEVKRIYIAPEFRRQGVDGILHGCLFLQQDALLSPVEPFQCFLLLHIPLCL